MFDLLFVVVQENDRTIQLINYKQGRRKKLQTFKS